MGRQTVVIPRSNSDEKWEVQLMASMAVAVRKGWPRDPPALASSHRGPAGYI
jgi:hypothetical protein